MTVLKDAWVQAEPTPGWEPSSYLEQLKMHLAWARDAAMQNLQQAQDKQKAPYDKQAKERMLHVGNQVLMHSALFPCRTKENEKGLSQ